MPIRIFLFILLSFTSSYSFCQTLGNYKAYTHQDGLCSNTTNDIIQDKYEFIWIGTKDGLTRFDGYKFTTYVNKAYDSLSLPDNDIVRLYLSKQNELWIITRAGGACKYVLEKNNFQRIPVSFNTNKNGLSDQYTTDICENIDGDLWIATLKGLNLYNPKTGLNLKKNSKIKCKDLKQIFLEHKKSFPDNILTVFDTVANDNEFIIKDRIRDICVQLFGSTKTIDIQNNIIRFGHKKLNYSLIDDQINSLFRYKNTLWIGYLRYGFSSLDLRTGIYTHFPDLEHIYGNSNINKISSLYADNDFLYIATEVGDVKVFDIKNRILKTIANKTILNIARNIKPYSKDELLIVSDQGLKLLNKNTLKLIDFNFGYDLRKTNMTSPTAVCFDIQGNLWLGTAYSGLYQFYVSKGFKSLLSFEKLSFANVSSVFQDKDKSFWVGYYTSGLEHFDQNWKHIKLYMNDLKNPHSIASESIFKIFRDDFGNLWVTNYFSGLQRYNPNTDDFTTIKASPKSLTGLPADDIRQITPDSKGKLWLATHGGGLSCFNPNTGKFKNYVPNYAKWTTNLCSEWLTDIKFDDKGIAYITSANGFSIFDTTKNTFRSYNKANSALPHDFINTVYIDTHQNIWFGSKSGLVLLKNSDTTINIINTEAELPNVEFKSIVQDKNETFWLSTNNGLFSFKAYSNNKLDMDLITKSIANYNIQDGITSNDYYPRSACIDSRNFIYFGSDNGITYFHPDNLKYNTKIPTIYFTQLKLFNKTILPNNAFEGRIILSKPLYITDTIQLFHTQNVITIEFCALNYINPNRNQFRYRLVGFDKEWQNIENKHEVTYTNLPPGTYKLIVCAANNDKIWNNNGKMLTIIVIPPFWQTLWFRILFIIFIAFILLLINYVRTNNVRRKNQLLQKLVTERTKELELKNEKLILQSKELNEANSVLSYQKEKIEIQASELQIQRDELERSNNTKDKLFSILAHDLKGPFNVILGFSELLIKNLEKYSKEKIETQLKIIRDSSRHTYDLLDNLLNWSRSQQGTIVFEPEPTSLKVLIEDMLPFMRQQAMRKEISIDLVMLGRERDVNIDLVMVNTVIRNLISNAIKYSFKNGNIVIHLHFNENESMITVKDSGMGIPSAIKEKLFNVSKHVTTQGTAGEKGTGLGLLLCADFVHKHNGKIWVESEMGKGSTFYFTLPY